MVRAPLIAGAKNIAGKQFISFVSRCYFSGQFLFYSLRFTYKMFKFPIDNLDDCDLAVDKLLPHLRLSDALATERFEASLRAGITNIPQTSVNPHTPCIFTSLNTSVLLVAVLFTSTPTKALYVSFLFPRFWQTIHQTLGISPSFLLHASSTTYPLGLLNVVQLSDLVKITRNIPASESKLLQCRLRFPTLTSQPSRNSLQLLPLGNMPAASAVIPPWQCHHQPERKRERVKPMTRSHHTRW